MPPAINPSAPSAASTPPVESSSSPTSRAMPTRATMTAASISRLSAFAFFAQGEALNVGRQFGLLAVDALIEEADFATAVIEDGGGQAAPCSDRLGYPAIAIGVARVGNRNLFEKGPGRV